MTPIQKEVYFEEWHNDAWIPKIVGGARINIDATRPERTQLEIRDDLGWVVYPVVRRVVVL